MAHHVSGSPFHSLLHSFSLPLQSTHVPIPSWSDVREAGGNTASRLKSCVKKALRSCSSRVNSNLYVRKTRFYVEQRRNQMQVLISPLEDFKNLVKEETLFPDELIDLIDAYAASESPAMESFRRKIRLATLLQRVPLERGIESVMGAVTTGCIGAGGAAISVGMHGLMRERDRVHDVQALMAAEALTVTVMQVLKQHPLVSDLDYFRFMASLIVGLMATEFPGATAASMSPTLFAPGTIVAGVFLLVPGKFSLGLRARVAFSEFCSTATVGAGVLLALRITPLGQLASAGAAGLIAVQLGCDALYAPPSWVAPSARNSVAAMTAASMLMQLATGSFIPGQIVVPGTGMIAAGLAAYRLYT